MARVRARAGRARAARWWAVSLALVSTLAAGAAVAGAPTGSVPPLDSTAPTPAPASAVASEAAQSELVHRLGELQRVGGEDPTRLVSVFAGSGPIVSPVEALLTLPGLKAVPFVWRRFFRSSMIVLGRPAGVHVRAGFYNALMDLWVLTEWEAVPTAARSDGFVRLARAWAASGEAIRDSQAVVEPVPKWTADATAVPPRALIRAVHASLRAFDYLDAAGIPPGWDAAFSWEAEYRTGLATRLLDAAGSLLYADSEPLRTPINQLLAAIRTARAFEFAQAFPRLGGFDAQVLDQLPASWRERFEVTAIAPTDAGPVVTFGIPGAGRWVLMSQLGIEQGSPVVRQLILLDLGLPEPEEAP
jgi:hypothetical protein